MTRRTWQDTDITIHRSSAHRSTWVANLPGTEVMTAIDSAGPLRACQQWTVRSAPFYGFDDVANGDRIRWVREDANTMRLEARVED